MVLYIYVKLHRLAKCMVIHEKKLIDRAEYYINGDKIKSAKWCLFRSKCSDIVSSFIIRFIGRRLKSNEQE